MFCLLSRSCSTALAKSKTRLTRIAPADLFAILKSTEKLERAYVRDAISAKEYEPLCSKLIGQYKTLYESLRDQVCM